MSAAESLQFELATGVLHADEAYVDRVMAGEAPRNLIELHALGRLVVGNAVEPGDDEAKGLVPLPRLLLSDRYADLPTDKYDRLDTDAWELEDYLDYGRWLNDLTEDPAQPRTRLSRQLIMRGYYAGIGPSVHRISHRQRFGNITAFYAGLEVMPMRNLFKYDDMSPQQLADYAEGVLQDLQSRAPEQTAHSLRLNTEIERRAQLGDGPALWIFKRNGGGGVMRHLTLNGYADAKNMTPEDYHELGIKIMRANGGRLLTPRAVDHLARSLRAPTSHAVMTKFLWTEYVSEVQAAYERRTPAQKLLAVRRELQAGTLPRYVIKGVPPQAAARRLDVPEDIWPPDEAYLTYLRVPPQLLTAAGRQPATA